MDTKIFLTAFATSFITLLLTKLWDWWRDSQKNKIEDRKSLNKALFNLTNLWQTLQTWDFEKQIDFTNEKLFEEFSKMGANTEKLEEIKLKASDKNKLVLVQTQLANEKLLLLEEQVHNSIEELSQIRPFVASELHEMQLRTPLVPMEKLIEEQLKDGKERTEYDFSMLASLQNQYFQTYKQKLSERVKPFILSIAKEIDKKTFKATNNYLETLEKQWSEVFDAKNSEDINNFAKVQIEMLLKAHKESVNEGSIIQTEKPKSKKPKTQN
jgi:hypothetical protein